MKQLKSSVIVGAAAVILGAATFFAVSSSARSEWTKTKASAKIAPNTKTSSTRKANAPKALPRFLSLREIKTLRELRAARPKTMADPLLPILAPQRLDGKGLPKSLSNLPLLGKKVGEKEFKTLTRTAAQRRTTRRTVRRNPAFPAPLPPAVIARAPRTTTPRWVRYPLEFQLAGVGLGTLAVNKDRYNRIDRYGLFAMHGNPTAVVAPIRVPVVESEGGAGGGGRGGAGGGGQGAGDVAGTADAPKTLTIGQQPPEYSPRFGLSQNGTVPAWANACIVDLDENHVEWLYNRGTYAMGFVVDRLGYVDGIVVAGTQSNIANTQLEDPEHTVRLGDDLRKVLFRYGYPDSFSSYLVTLSGQVSAPAAGGGNATGQGGRGGAGGGGGGAQGTTGTSGTNNVHRIFEVRYEQSYNIVFTVAYNRVIRMYIFGDPDYFNAARRQNLRTSY